jgi:hypothetical protein
MAISFLKRSPMQKFEAELAALTARADQLGAKRASAQKDLDRALAAREEHLLVGNLDDDKVGAKLQAAVDTGLSTLAGLDLAIQKQAAFIAEAERKLAVEKDIADRKAVAETMTAQILAVTESLAPWLEFSRKFAANFEAMSYWRPEAGQVSAYLRNAASEIENCMALTGNDLLRAAAGVRDGHGPIPRAPAAPAPQVKAVPQAPTTRTVFAFKHLVWTDTEHIVHRHPRGNACVLPIPLADKAVAAGHACEISDPRRKQMSGVFGAVMPALEQCVSLDGTPTVPTTKQPIDPIVSSHVFEPSPYANREPRTVVVPVRPVEPASARMLPDEQ